MTKYRQLNIRISEEDLRVLRYRMANGRYKTMSQYLRNLFHQDRRFSPVDDTARVDVLTQGLYRLNDRLQSLERFLNEFERINVSFLGEKVSESVEEKLDEFFKPLDKALVKIHDLISKRTEGAVFFPTFLLQLFVIFVEYFYLNEYDTARKEEWKKAVDFAKTTAQKNLKKNLDGE